MIGVILASFLFIIFPSLAYPFIIAAYYQSWSQFYPAHNNRPPFRIEDIDARLITDLYFAFAVFGFSNNGLSSAGPRLTGDFSIKPLYQNDEKELYRAFSALKQCSKTPLRILLAIGGWGFNDPRDPQKIGTFTFRLFSTMAAFPDRRKEFIASCILAAHRFGFDGIDIDWEFPGDLSRGGSRNDFAHYELLLKEAKEAFQKASPPLILSIAVPASIPFQMIRDYPGIEDWYWPWLARCANHVDRLTVMAYDYHTSSGGGTETGANAPLLRDTNPASMHFIRRTLDTYVEHGVPAQKMLLGLPLYGWSYGNVEGLTEDNQTPGKRFQGKGIAGDTLKIPGFLAYYEIGDKIAKRELNFNTDPATGTAFGYNLHQKQWVSFDTPETIALKVNLAREMKLGGVIFWSIDMDEYHWSPVFPNLRAANSTWN